MMESEDYLRGLSMVTIAGVRVLYSDAFAEVNAPPKVALIAIDAEVKKIESRLAELRGARSAIVRDLKAME